MSPESSRARDDRPPARVIPGGEDQAAAGATPDPMEALQVLCSTENIPHIMLPSVLRHHTDHDSDTGSAKHSRGHTASGLGSATLLETQRLGAEQM